ncbi:DnaJ domain-containing protein, partial [Nocardioides sp. GCM10027114]
MATSSPDSTRGPGSPSWYDLLGVDATASKAEIKDAWRAATADRDPTDRRFKLANQAAEVLLDDEQRAAYDAALAERAAVEAERPEPADEPDGLDEPGATGVTAAAAAGAGPAAPAAVPATTPSATPGAALAGLRAGAVPAWAVVALAVVTLAVAGLTAYLWSTPSDSEVEDSTRAAQAA